MSLLRPLNKSNWIELRAESADSHHVLSLQKLVLHINHFMLLSGLFSSTWTHLSTILLPTKSSDVFASYLLQVMNKNNKERWCIVYLTMFVWCCPYGSLSSILSESHSCHSMLLLPPLWANQTEPAHMFLLHFLHNWLSLHFHCSFSVASGWRQEAARPDVKDPQGAPELHHIAPCFSKVCLASIRWTHNDVMELSSVDGVARLRLKAQTESRREDECHCVGDSSGVGPVSDTAVWCHASTK